ARQVLPDLAAHRFQSLSWAARTEHCEDLARVVVGRHDRGRYESSRCSFSALTSMTWGIQTHVAGRGVISISTMPVAGFPSRSRISAPGTDSSKSTPVPRVMRHVAGHSLQSRTTWGMCRPGTRTGPSKPD